MTPKQILDSFSETLMQDERILSARERALVTTLLHHAKTASNGNSETQAAVHSAIASAVGETVSQRAFAVVGGSIVERILRSSPLAVADTANGKVAAIQAEGPVPPNQPQPPHIRRTPIAPLPQDDPGPGQPSNPQQPQPPHVSLLERSEPKSRTAVLEPPAVSVAQCVVLDEFLAPQELEELTRFTMAHEIDFCGSEVVSRSSEQGVTNYEHRRSRVLMDLGPHQEIMLERIKSVLPQVALRLGLEEFMVDHAEVQITASNDGDFFCNHNDNGDAKVASRHLTFVYFFHREPRQFSGGELHIHDSRMEGDRSVSVGSCQSVVPQQNQIVFFPCSLLHEITPVKCPSGLFADSRFTLNGWLHR